MKRERFLTPKGGHIYMTAAGAVDMADATTAAERGDLEPLLRRLRSGSADDREQAFAADLIKGRPERAKGRPASVASAAQRYDVACFVWLYELAWGCKREASVAKAMEHFEVGRKYVFDALREAEADLNHRAHAELFVTIWRAVSPKSEN